MKQDNRSDEELHEALSSGDSRAGALLYDRYFWGVRGFFINKVADPGAWDDLAQETFMVVLRKPERFRKESSFRSYLFGVAHFVLLAHYRKERRKQNRVDAFDEDIAECAVADLGPGLSTLVARRAEAQRMIEALRKIPIKYQTLFEMYFLQELSANDIARIHGCSIGTVRGRIRLAMKALIDAIGLGRGTFGELLRSYRSVDAWAGEVREQLREEGGGS